MSRALKIVLIVAALAAIAAGALFLWDRSHPPSLPAPPPKAEAPAPAQPAGPKHPLDTSPPADKPLPPLAASDAEVRESFTASFGPGVLERLLLEDLVRKVVATIDNLPREEYAARLNPVKPVPGLPATSGKGEQLALAGENAARYAGYVGAFSAIQTDAMVAMYKRYYPLFQQAYVELGYPNGYFNDRLVEVIDHLLDTPDVPGPLRLTQPKVLYEFADPELEERSAGQKVLIRMGPANAARVKAKLKEIRDRVAR